MPCTAPATGTPWPDSATRIARGHTFRIAAALAQCLDPAPLLPWARPAKGDRRTECRREALAGVRRRHSSTSRTLHHDRCRPILHGGPASLPLAGKRLASCTDRGTSHATIIGTSDLDTLQGEIGDAPEGGAGTLLFNEIQLLLAEKRTSLSVLRTGIAILVLPLSVLSVLIATSRLYGTTDVLHFLVPVLAISTALTLLAFYLIVRALHRIHVVDRHIAQLKNGSRLITELLR